MAYLEPGRPAATRGGEHAVRALRSAARPQRYDLQHPAAATNLAGWEVQCLWPERGWVTASRAPGTPAVFASRQAALACLDALDAEEEREYRLYPSFAAPDVHI